jgi:hypothetical protein
LHQEKGIAIYIDGARFKIQNQRKDSVVARHVTRPDEKPLALGITLPPNAILEFPARDVRGSIITFEQAECFDIVAPRKFAIVHHAGVLIPRPTLADDLSLGNLNISRK